MSEEMKAEFDTVAAWTAEVALDLGPDHYLPAGCRGSGSPGALRWLLDRLEVTGADVMLDCGAGVGGPAAFAQAEVGVRPVLSEPEAGACRAAARLFGLPVVRAASRLPFASGSFDVVWSLGVLCTVPDQPELLAELRRVLRPEGRLGLLVFVATRPLPEQPVGNTFPTEESLRSLLTEAGLVVENSASATDFAGTPPLWQQHAAEVETELERRHGDDPAWQVAGEQSAVIGRLLAAGELVGTLVAARPG
ncbi:MAG: class I SAM-dependent methyltransferase [Friedmanniella sp.]